MDGVTVRVTSVANVMRPQSGEPGINQRNVASSVRARLLSKACAEKLNFNLLITRWSAGVDAPRQLPNVMVRFATSPQRRQILRGWLGYRAALHGIGLTDGLQWLDGSFLEQVETLETRPPKDMDVVTFLNPPAGFAPTQ